MNGMNQTDIISWTSIFVLLSAFAYLVWERRWSWMGLFVATGCLVACIAHVQILTDMLFQPAYANKPTDFAGIVWAHELGWGLLLSVISLTMFAAMVGALRSPKYWSTSSICLASVYLLSTTGAWVVQRWISIGELPSLSFGFDLPVWLGFPAFLALVLGPFVVAIPWSLSRSPQASGNEANGIIAQFRVTAGTVGIMLAIIGGSVALGLAQNQWSHDARTERLLAIFAIAQALTVIAAAGMAIGFRRSFLAPAISIIEGIRNDKPLADPEKMVAIWTPLAKSVEEGRREAELNRQELVKSAEALHQSEKLAALGQLLAGVSHELNNPLTVVVGRSAILEEKLRDTPHAESISHLREAADRCNRIVKTFLAMARQSAPRREPVLLSDAIAAAYDMTAYGLRTAEIEVKWQLSDVPQINADQDQLVQVLINLFINATHALQSHDGKRQLTVRLNADSDGQNAVIDVSDTGPGIDDQNISRIFEPFFTTKPVNEGTGMGLSMARGLIEQHDGTLTHHRTKGGGATFRITLPIEAVAPEENRDDTDDAQPIATAAARILIVDDEASIRMMLAECFGDVYDCVQCDSGVSALAAIEAEAFDLIFCDIRMPEMDGAALHRHLCAAHPEQAARMVFMTGDVLNRKGSLHAGIEGRPIIEKPFNPLDVRKLAARLVEDLGPIEWIQP